MTRILAGKLIYLLVVGNCSLLQSAVVHGPIFNPSNGHMYYLPALRVRRERGQILIAWHAAFEGAVIETTTDLSPPVPWEAVGVAVQSNGSERFVLVTDGGGKQFFRLRAI